MKGPRREARVLLLCVMIVVRLVLSSTLAIFRIMEQIQWFSGSELEALSPCFARVFFCKWPKSSSGARGIVFGAHRRKALCGRRGGERAGRARPRCRIGGAN